jgi:hypothetical chaperone protein
MDFGTSNSTVAWNDQGKAQLLRLEEQHCTLPSVVFFNAEDESMHYGRVALQNYLDGYEGRLMRSMKSLLGTSLLDGHTQVAGRQLAFRDLLSSFLGELKRRSERSAQQQWEYAVLGRPVFFVDDDPKADQKAQQSLQELALAQGFKEVQFQFEPIAAALDYEANLQAEEIVLVVDIGGGTSDFSIVRLSPERRLATEREKDILGYGGVHIGGTDFDKYLSLNKVMPLLGMHGKLANQTSMPSAMYFDLATWHTINLAYVPKLKQDLQNLYRDISEPATKIACERLQQLIQERDGHWLAMQVEQAKIALSANTQLNLHLDRLHTKQGGACQLEMTQTDLETAVQHLLSQIALSVQGVLQQSELSADQIDTVFFTGGASQVGSLRERIIALFPSAKVETGDLFGSIGSGLALDARRKFS